MLPEMLPETIRLAEIAWRATAVLALAQLLVWMLRRRSAAERHGLWVLAAVCLLALPFWPDRTAATVIIPAPQAISAPLLAAINTAPATPARPPVVPTLWLAGAILMTAYSVIGMLLLAVRHRNGRRPSPLQSLVSVRRHPRVFESASCQSPITWGVLRPVILLPEESRQWSHDKQRSVILHELHHIQRFDYLTQLLAQCMRALYWFHPLAWTAVAALRRESEKACDDAVLQSGLQPANYARHLLDLAQPAPRAAVAMARPSGLESRIHALLNPSIPRHGVAPRSRIAGALAVCVLSVAVSSLVIRAQAGSGLFGSVLDDSGGAVPNVEVRAISEDGKRVEIAIAGPDGVYRFAELPVGKYKVEARAPGFMMLVRSGVEVKQGTINRADLNLSLGRISERIEVVGTRKTAPPPPARSAVPQRIRVGGNVQATKVLRMARPEYPEHLQEQGIEGMVLLEGVISKDGNLLSLHSLNSLVHPDLTRAAINAVSQWLYQPTLLNGQPVEVITTITVNFKLKTAK
ncbi:MAG: TonB family protein [Acidobacteria bacterium]|nr:TonB family protein [Acidobacteriota bacterium]